MKVRGARYGAAVVVMALGLALAGCDDEPDSGAGAPEGAAAEERDDTAQEHTEQEKRAPAQGEDTASQEAALDEYAAREEA